LVTSFLAGFYPALILSGFNPVKTLYNRSFFAGKNYLSKGLVVLQFTLTTFLIIATITIYRQFNFLTTRELGYNDDNIVTVNIPNMKACPMNTLKNELLQNPGIVQIAGVNGGSWTTVAKVDEKDMDFAFQIIDPDYLPLLNVPMALGRNLSSDFPSDSTQSVLVNETFARKAGWKDLNGKQVDFFYDSLKYNVVGVVKDYHYESLLSEIRPQLFIMVSKNKYSYGKMAIKVKPESIQSTLAHIKKVFKTKFPFEHFSYSFQDEKNKEQYQSEARWKDIIGFAAILTVLVSCLGLFGLARLSAEKRIKEIGILKVLGASITDITATLSSSFLKLILLASFLAFPAAWFSLKNWLQDYPVRINLDLWTFALAGFVVLLLGLVTVGFQAIKSALANPVKCLRTE
jgi:ABC-type antimicrobial peptide transport system permease subunit